MIDAEIQEKAVEVMVVMNSAITNLRLYPPTSAMINNTIDRVYETLLAILKEEDSLILAESERNILVCGQLLSQKDQEKPQVMAFLELLLNFGIKSIMFEKGLNKADLLTFLEILKGKPRDVEKEGGLQEVITSKKLLHVLLDQKIYVARDKDRQVLAGIDIKDEQIVRYMTGADSISDPDLQKIKDMAKDPEWISRVFQSGLKHIAEQGEVGRNIKLSKDVVRMIRVLDNIVDKIDKDKIALHLASSILDMDIETIGMVLTQNIEGLLGDRLFDHIINQMDDDKFERVAAKINSMSDRTGAEDGKHDRIEFIDQVYKRIINSDKGRQLQSKIQEIIAYEKEQKERLAVHLEEAINNIFKGDKKIFLDKQVMQSLPGIIERLFSQDQNQKAEEIIEKLGEGLLSEDSDVRAQLSEALIHIVESLTAEKRTETMCRLSNKLVRWIKFETLETPAYKQICFQLQNLVQTLIRNYQFADCDPILEIFNLIYSGQVKKSEAIQNIAGNVLKGIPSGDLLDILLKEFLANEKNKREEVSRILNSIGAAPVDRLLDVLRESQDSSERVRILQLISNIGHPAIPALTERIKQDEPWYYIRNLAFLLGKVGSEAHVNVLQPLLFHEDLRAQQEALKSIYSIGGTYRGEVFLSVLPTSDDRLKISIVNMLGVLKYREAECPLLKLLKDKSFITSKIRTELEENICVALGRIGTQKAIPVLTAIAKQKSLLNIRSYNAKVKVAAGRALARINKRQTQEEDIEFSEEVDTKTSTP